MAFMTRKVDPRSVASERVALLRPLQMETDALAGRLQSIIAEMTRPNPRDRAASAAELAERLSELASGNRE
jgi:hypothetical protein